MLSKRCGHVCYKAYVKYIHFISGVECTDVPVSQMDTYPDGFICGSCPIGLVGDGQSCEGIYFAMQNTSRRKLLSKHHLPETAFFKISLF